MFEILGVLFLLDFIIGQCEQQMVYDVSNRATRVYIHGSTGMIGTSAGAPACSMGTPEFSIYYRREDIDGSF
jgi:hypothetical protein